MEFLTYTVHPETDPLSLRVTDEGYVPSLRYKAENSLIRADDAPDTELVIGDNLAALTALTGQYEGKVDAIYIDPPYNTGKNIFTYKDGVKGGRRTRHEVWLSLMQRRLEKAYSLLSPTGVMMVSIGNDEHAHLKLLLDGIFGAQNFIDNIVWIGNGASNGTFTRSGIDYILIYGKNKKALAPWRTPKPGADEMIALVDSALLNGATRDEAQSKLRAYIKRNPHLSGGLKGYANVDMEGEVYSTASLVNALYRPNLMFDVTDPATGRVYPSPSKGWTLSKELFEERIKKGEIVFQANRPRRKLYLRERGTMLPSPIIEDTRSIGTEELRRIIGRTEFTYPKNTAVILRWLRTVTYDDPDAVVMDFFAGSGTTGQAVMEMNAVDGGNRKCILVTNNENAIADTVTIPRLWNVLTGEWADNKSRPALRGNLKVYELE